jgi:hypothetical protein
MAGVDAAFYLDLDEVDLADDERFGLVPFAGHAGADNGNG